MECSCKKKNCIRHGKCEDCIKYHKTTRREPYCRRKEHNVFVIITFVLIGLLVIGIIVFATTS
jgi:hypothetical protein